MNGKEITTEIRLAQWTELLKERAATGETINEFCRNRGFSRNAFFYWQRRVRSAIGERLMENQGQRELAAPGFAEVKLPGPAQSGSLGKGEIRVELSGLRITADGAYPVAGLAELIRAVTAPC